MTNDIQNYKNLLGQVKQRVAQAQRHTIYAANEELLHMYWDLGQMLHTSQQAEGWGKGTLARLSADMKNEFPEEKGFSERNLRCMVEFYLEYNQELTSVKQSRQEILQPPVAKLTSEKESLQFLLGWELTAKNFSMALTMYNKCATRSMN